MKYIKYFDFFKEGFTTDELNNLIFNNETYVRKIYREISISNKLRDISDKLIKYDISGFSSSFLNGFYIIKPDSNFEMLYKKYCEINNISYNPLSFEIEFTKKHPISGYNTLDVYGLIDDNLKGLSLGYKLYLFILNKEKFISSDRRISDDAKNLWYNLLKSDLVYAGTSTKNSIIILKDINDDELREILNTVKQFNYIYDSDLKKRIDSFGSI